MDIIPADDQQGLFVINIFTVRPENQRPLIECIRQAGDPGDVPGLLSMHLLRSLDGTQVINHMYWESEAAFSRERAANPLILATRDRVNELVQSARPNVYEIVH